MAKADLEEFYEMVADGDTVELVGERNEETADLFDSGREPTIAPLQPTFLAKAEPAATTQEQTTSGNVADMSEPMAAGSLGVTGKW
jgi:hypothetical protein